jgi:hypothetical protein
VDELPAEYPADRATDRADGTADTTGMVGAPFRSNTVGTIGFGRGSRIGGGHRFAGRGAEPCLGSIGAGQGSQDCHRKDQSTHGLFFLSSMLGNRYPCRLFHGQASIVGAIAIIYPSTTLP